jgi:type II secretory pathway predicted ATPase ExeA/phage tail protein X
VFLEFYKLREQPFGVTPDPRYLYLGNAHRKALAHLLYSIETKRGFSALIAEPGMGKTSLLFQILESMQDSARTAFLFQTVGDSRELLRCLLYDLAIKCASEDPSVMRETLNANLLQELHSGKQVIVVFDEAQNLDSKILETIRLLSNFETTKQKLMHIVLAGQPALADKLSDGSMTQLRQRIATIVRLDPFSGEEVAAYVHHRLQTAGLEGPSMFTADALELIARVSQGIPRNINNLCFQALSIGFARQSAEIGAPIMQEVVSEVQLVAPLAGRTVRRVSTPTAAAPRGVPSPQPAGPGERVRPGEPVHLRELARLGAWEEMRPSPPRSSRLKWLAGLACLAALPAAMIALSDTRLGLSDTLPGKISERVVNAVLGTTSRSPSPVPSEPSNEPKAPARAASDSSTGDSPSLPLSSGQATAPNAGARGSLSPNADAGQPNGNASGSGSSARPKSNREHDRANPATTETDTLFASNQSYERSRAGTVRDIPATIQILRSETVFQLAVELYGHSNWIIVEALCAANPEIHDPYSVLTVGQTIRLPSDLVTVTQDYNNSHGAVRPSR